MFKKTRKVIWLFSIQSVLIASLLITACSPTSTATSNIETPQPTAISLPQIEPVPIQPEIPSVHEAFANFFPIGAAIMSHQLNDGEHVYLLTHHFNGITPENEMKPISIQPVEGQFDWSGADRLVQFATANNMEIHGHTLVWHNQVPEWMFNDSQGNPLTPTDENKALVLERLKTHIHALVGRYKGQIKIWDVVNEVIDPSYPDCMRRTKWFELTGTDYISTAFQAAREADPNAQLLINDYGTTDPARRSCFYNLISDLLAEGVPVDGVGHQMHVNVETPSANEIEETILLFADLGLGQYITELDMSLYSNDTDSYTRVPQEVLIKQGHRYKEIFEVFKRQSAHIKAVTFWGMADDHTWLKTWPIPRINLPLLFDEDLQPKYAYWGIVDPSPEHLPMFIQNVNISQGVPVIDAIVDELWKQQPWIVVPGTQSVTAKFQTRWDEEHLFLFVDIAGSPDEISRIEVFVDENKNKTKTYEKDDRHYIFENGNCIACDGVSFVEATDNGYQLEAALPFNLANGRPGQRVGFDIRVTEKSQLDTPFSWNDFTNNQDTDTSQFGTLIFARSSKLISVSRGSPVIDAVEDAIWASAIEETTDIWVMGNSGATAKVKVLWDDERLYVYAVVTDSLLSDASRNSWEQDSFEVFLDQNNAKTTSYQSDDAQYRINFNNEQTFNGGAKPELISSATQITPDGYIVELAIKFDAIQPQEGMLIGFDFQVNNDENGDGNRDSISKWNDPTDNSYMNTSGFGLLQLIK